MMVEIQKILFPCDLTPHSTKILQYALALVEKFGSDLVVLHVVQDLREWAGLYMPHKHLDLEQKDVEENARKSLIQFCDSYLEEDARVSMRVMSGDPASQIIASAKNESADLIVMGTHGRRGMEYSLFGSVAARVVRFSLVPVLTVNPDHLILPEEQAPGTGSR